MACITVKIHMDLVERIARVTIVIEVQLAPGALVLVTLRTGVTSRFAELARMRIDVTGVTAAPARLGPGTRGIPRIQQSRVAVVAALGRVTRGEIRSRPRVVIEFGDP